MRAFLLLMNFKIYHKNFYLLILLVSLFLSCNDPKDESIVSDVAFSSIIAVDISRLPEVLESHPTFYDENNQVDHFLDIIAQAGINTVRLKLWVNPENNYGSINEVFTFASEIRQRNLKLWITLHYSDTWAHPGQQVTPAAWDNLTIQELEAEVYTYTAMVMQQLQPEYIQIGNEINTGILFPYGDIQSEYAQFKSLLTAGVTAVRDHSDTTQIILHNAGINNANWFYEQVATIDYDIIGLSYYPLWHGQDLNVVESTMNLLNEKYEKPIVIAETAYPFTLDWNDWTNNIVGLEEQLIPSYPATPSGQQGFIYDLKQIVNRSPYILGICYWGAEQIAWKGAQATDGSPWENQALFDFNNQALPTLRTLGDQ